LKISFLKVPAGAVRGRAQITEKNGFHERIY
jgi:hypothetical protein